jgi:hypothetical protein
MRNLGHVERTGKNRIACAILEGDCDRKDGLENQGVIGRKIQILYFTLSLKTVAIPRNKHVLAGTCGSRRDQGHDTRDTLY